MPGDAHSGSDTESVVDEILVLDCQNGSVDALEALVSRWQKRLWRHGYCLTRDAEGAWDVTQESWLAIIRGLSRLEDPARFPAWAFRIVTNKARDWLRRKRRLRQPSDGQLEDQPAPGAGEALRRETLTDLFQVLLRLPADQGAVLSLYYLEGLAVSEVARSLGIPEGTVKSRLYAARAAFKNLWQTPGDAH